MENTNVFNKGLYIDTNEKNLPKGSYYYALNSVLETKEGDLNAISNQLGNEACGIIPSGYSIIGYTLTDKDEFIIFLTNPTTGLSEIGIYKGNDCVYTPIILENSKSNKCLNFSVNHPISALMRIKNGCDRIIYFTDNYNPYRSINIDDVSSYVSGNDILCNNLNLTKNLTFPDINTINIDDSGGSLKLGSYQFIIRYLDEDLNPTNWLNNTPHIYVYDEPITSNYNTIDGGKNIIDSSSEIGVYPKTSKSIELNVSNIDNQFAYYQYAIIEYSSSLQTQSQILLSEYIPISRSSWTYTGFNTSGSTTLADIVVDKQVIDIVKTHQQIDNRLFLANISESKKYNWAKLQRAALSITNTWVAKIKPKNSLQDGDPKSDQLYKSKSYMRDEVYSFGIRGVLKNGSYTPVVHIPGRPSIDNTHPNWTSLVTAGNSNNKDIINLTNPLPHQVLGLRDKFNGSTQSNWDKNLLTITTSKATALGEGFVYKDNAEHLGISSGTVERWKLFNTSIITNITSTDAEGQMAYYESTQTYPINTDCDGDYIYGNLQGSPIRHHKFPDTNTFPHVLRDGNEVGKIAYIGIKFDINSFITNLTTNHPELLQDISKWEIVQAQRTDNNKTILDKGITTFREVNGLSYLYGGDNRTPGSAQEPSGIDNGDIRTDTIRFYSPKALLNRQLLSPSYMKIEYANLYDNWRNFNYSSFDVSNKNKPTFFQGAPGLDIDRGSALWLTPDYLDGMPFKNTREYYPSNILITANTYIDGTSNYDDYSFVQGTLGSLPTKFVRNYNYTSHVYQLQGSFQTVFTNDSSLYNIQDPLTLYASIKTINDVYSNLDAITYFTIPNDRLSNIITVFGGDTFITPFNFQISNRGVVWRDNFANIVDCPTNKFFLGHEHIFFYVESDINTAMRHASIMNPFEDRTDITYDDNCGRYYKGGWIYKGTIDAMKDRFLASLNPWTLASDLALYRFGSLDMNTVDANKINLCKEFFGYNKDYSNHNNLKPFYGVGFNYNYCDTCENKHPYRILYSQKSFQEERSDNYKQFLTNNYLDLDGSTGEINWLFKDKDQLYAITDKSLYFLPTRPQSIQSNESSIYIGTGDVLSIPPKRISTTDYGYSGTKDIWSIKTTEFGTLYTNSESGKVFHLSGELKEISNNGMRNFFHTYLPITFIKDLKKNYSIDYPINVLTSSNGVGITTGYDPRYRLYNITKKDYELSGQFMDDYENNIITWTSSTNTFNDVATNTVIPIDNNPQYFIPKTWTISYSLEKSVWTSFHSYYPNIYLSNNIEMFSFKSGIRIWVHNKGNYQTYYNNKYPHIIEFISNDNPDITKVLNGLNLYSKVYIKNGEQFAYLSDKTFNSIIIYNSNQSTNSVPLVISTNPFQTGANVRNIQNYTYISNLRNVFPANNTSTSNIFIGPYFNRTINPFTPISSMFNQERLRDQWFGIRLEFNPLQNYKITTDIISTSVDVSAR